MKTKVTQRDEMTGDEAEEFVEVGNYFWDQFSMLIAECLAKMPEDLQSECLGRLGEASSVYGSCYDEHIEAARAAAKEKT